MTNEAIELKHAPNVCCPDYGCIYSSWDGKTCSECEYVCEECAHFTIKEPIKLWITSLICKIRFREGWFE